MTLFENAYNDVAELVRKFETAQDYYLSTKYQEAELRLHFLDDFWNALGWDVRHREQTNPREQEVKIERSDTASYRKADYAFFLKPDFNRPVFLVEAKKPSVGLESVEFYFQTARYGFNTGTSVAILTNFQEFHLIDCRRKPEFVPAILASRLETYRYTDFKDRDKFGDFYWYFSREAVAAGKLREYWKSLPKPRGAEKQLRLIDGQLQTPDDLFLADLDNYRQTLASAFKSANREMTSEELTDAAQKALDRLVFIRFLQDKQIEGDDPIEKFLGSNVSSWNSFIALSKKLDKFYNGVVFKRHVIDEAGFQPPKEERFRTVASAFSHHHSPYLFSYIPVEILGAIYERFLGKVVVPKGSGIAVEEKPEVRKAGGVYYTPKYIVDYIVENTVGKILEGKTPEEVFHLRFADIACGSGSFLISVFDRIEKHLEEWYNARPHEAQRSGCREVTSDNGQTRYTLSLEQKRAILQSNIYGVDIDHQAVEVAQFSLFLKLLDSETIATVHGFAETNLQLKGETRERRNTKKQAVAPGQLTFHSAADRKILPDLSKNIQCGNSLVEYDILDQQTLFATGTGYRGPGSAKSSRRNPVPGTRTPLSPEEEMKIKPFSFQQAFRPIMDAGGFDAIVGNPPYGAQLERDLRHYFANKLGLSVPETDTFILFLLRSVSLAKKGGQQGYIMPSSWLYMPTYSNTRKKLLTECTLNHIEWFRAPVFPKVVVETCVEIVTNKTPNDSSTFQFREIEGNPMDDWGVPEIKNQAEILQRKGSSITVRSGDAKLALFEKIEAEGTSLKQLALAVCGLTPYRLGKGKPKQTRAIVDARAFDADFKKDNTYRQYIMGRDFHRYSWQIEKPRWISYGDWLAEPRYKAPFDDDIKIVVRQTADSIIANIDNSKYASLKNVHNLRITGTDLNYSYLLGILNSKLITWWYRQLIPETNRVFAEVKVVNLEKLPIKTEDSTNKATVTKFVDQMLATKKQLSAAQREAEREQLQRKCDYLDGEIDKLVYQLYGLTEDEVRIVEGKK